MHMLLSWAVNLGYLCPIDIPCIKMLFLFCQMLIFRDLCGSPVVRIPPFLFRGHRFNPWSVN